MIASLYQQLKKWFFELGIKSDWNQYLGLIISLIVIFLVAMILYYITRRVIWSTLPRLVSKTKSRWDDFMFKNKFFRGFAHLFPAALFYNVSNFADADFHTVTTLLTEGTKIYLTLIIVYLIDRFLDTVLDIYNTYPFAKERPIKGYLQMVKIFLYVVAGIIIISILLKKTPSTILAGLGAMAAVLLLVFKDTILGFVASIQLAANHVLKIGDWIEMPSRMADGTVEDITLNTVKVQNWDKTITTIPTYAMISESVKNWRGMEESGGRRIKKSFFIDVNSVKTIDEERYQDLIKNKFIKEDQTAHKNISNLTLYRNYTKNFLKSHPKINKSMTLIVRQLQQTPHGLPLEIYAFSTIKEWEPYENIQSEIIESLLAALPHFGLKSYQYPTNLPRE